MMSEEKKSCCCGGGDASQKTAVDAEKAAVQAVATKGAEGEDAAEQGAKGESEGSCCCGGDSDGCCDSSSYSCEDDPYAGAFKPVVVDFLYLDLTVCDRCQGADKRVERAVELCAPVLAACGYELVLNSVNVRDERMAKRYRFASSPTIRVNGRDICPTIEENDCGCCSDLSDSDVACRIFPFNGTHYEVPPTDMIVRGIIEAVFGEGALADERETADDEPFEVPENLVTFFRGRAAKEAAEAEGAAQDAGANDGDAAGADAAEQQSSANSCCCGSSSKSNAKGSCC
jgi:hypothetical protein